MREVPTSISAAWNEGLFIGDRKPIARVTVQHPDMFLRHYSLMSTFSYKDGTKDKTVKDVDVLPVIDLTHGMKVQQTYADFLFTGHDNHAKAVQQQLKLLFVQAGNPSVASIAAAAGLSRERLVGYLKGVLPSLANLIKIVIALNGDVALFTDLWTDRVQLEIPKELPNVASVNWTRSVDTDVADCTIECWNTKPLEIGEAPRDGEIDLPGYFTYDRGATAFSQARWGHVRNDWFGMLVPDNIIRTYEGYGYDADSIPELDENLVQTGVWIIDSVTTTDRGTLSIKCRDLGRILLDQMYYAPVVPDDFYDEDWRNWSGDFPGDPVTSKVKVKLRASDSSNTTWIGAGNSIAGHKLAYAFDGDPNTFWLSIGNDRPSRRFAYEWVEATVGNQTVSQVRVRTKKKGYICYVSIKVGGVWQGTTGIDYHRDGIGHNGANIKYVKSVHINTEGFVDIKLGKNYAKVQAIRITVGNLPYFPNIGTYHYRGAIRDVEAYGLSTKAGKLKHFKPGPAGSNPNRYLDYTDIVKLLCAWGGFFWPDKAKLRLSDGTYRSVYPIKFDTGVLGKGVRGRVWGDFQETGTTGPAQLDHSNFDKKPLMDGIAYIRDILGFIFYIDETGACVWRQPNIHDYGSRWSAFSDQAGVYVPTFAHHIDEDSVLLSLSTVLDSKNVRESIFVGDTLGKLAAFAPGFNPNPTGLRRIAGWTDQNFQTQAECGLMADMLSLRQLFTYRVDKLQIPANPAIQIDDQVRISERTTAEGYVHYVKGIASSLDMTSGQWTYDLETHWLGYDRPESQWLFNPGQLSPTTQAVLLDQRELANATLPYTRKMSDT